MIPPSVLDDAPDAAPLTDNAFVVNGYSLGYVRVKGVRDVSTGRSCAVEVHLEQREVRTGPRADDPVPPPGSVQFEGTLTVRFRPARPGHTYRLETTDGSRDRTYQGPAVPGLGLLQRLRRWLPGAR